MNALQFEMVSKFWNVLGGTLLAWREGAKGGVYSFYKAFELEEVLLYKWKAVGVKSFHWWMHASLHEGD